KSKRWPKR
ncbi:hypothetical protein QUC31_005940, partial [Theobroma cacao]